MSNVYDKLDNTTQPDLQAAKLGTLIEGAPIIVKKVVDTDATGELAITIPYDMYVVDVIVHCTASNASGEMTIKNGSTAITDAIICAVDHVVTRAGTIDDDQASLLAGDTVTVDAHRVDDRGIIWIIGYRI